MAGLNYIKVTQANHELCKLKPKSITMCNCLNETLVEITEKITDTLPKDADKLTLNVEYQNQFFRFDGKENNVMVGISFDYYKIKKDTTRAKNKTKGNVNLAMSYCPFCGDKYP